MPKKLIKNIPKDQWETEDPFDPTITLEGLVKAEPYKKGSDEKGHHETIGFRAPASFMRNIVRLKEMRGSPYDTNADVARDACYIGMQVLHLRYQMEGQWDVEAKMDKAIEDAGAISRINDSVGSLECSLSVMMNSNAHVQAMINLTNYVRAADNHEKAWLREVIFDKLRNSPVVRQIVNAPWCKPEVRKLIQQGAPAPAQITSGGVIT